MVKHDRGESMTVNMQLLYLFCKHIGKKNTNCTLQQWFLTTGSPATHIGNIVFGEPPGRLRVKYIFGYL